MERGQVVPVNQRRGQEAPGRYVAEFPADKAGSYLMAINTGQENAAPLLTVVLAGFVRGERLNIYSPERY